MSEYCGEIVESGLCSPGSCYLWELNKKFCIDGSRLCNISAFFNHECVNANLSVLRVQEHHRDPLVHRIVVFSARNIAAGEELTISYDARTAKEGMLKGSRCYCQSRVPKSGVSSGHNASA